MPIDWAVEAAGFNLDEEVRNGWTVTVNDKKIWCVELNIAKKLLEICNRHNLVCVSGGGTLLGAIRHNGFIPWDKDMDFLMPRDDYNKLCTEYADEFTKPYYFQTVQRETKWFRGHAKIRDSRTTCFGEIDKGNTECNNGIYIDVFPMDGEPNPSHKIKTKLFRFQVRLLRSLCFNATYGGRTGIKGIVLNLLTKLAGGEAKLLDRKFHKLCSKYSGDKSRKVRPLSFDYSVGGRCDFAWDYNDIFKTELHQFENIEVPIGVGYDRCLSIQFGDYMQFPPVNERFNDSEYRNPDMPYAEYYRLKASEKNDRQ